MKETKLLSVLMLLFMHPVFAKDLFVEKSALGDLSLQTEQIKNISSFKGRDLMAKVSYLPGSPYVFKSPINVQQLEFLRPNGAKLEKNQAFAKLKGPEVHHFYAVYEMKKVLFAQASAHYRNSKKLYQNKSLSEKSWLDISNDYHDTTVEFDELQHFFDLVLGFDEQEEALTLGAPLSSVLQFSLVTSLDANMTIAAFVPVSAIKLKISLPFDSTKKPVSFSADSCHLALDYLEAANSGFHQVAWTEGLTSKCDFSIGQVVSATPVYEGPAYIVKKASVSSFEGQQYIFVDSGTRFRGAEVKLLSSQANTYIVQSEEQLVGKAVLVSSVSAVQGVLQGLGL